MARSVLSADAIVPKLRDALAGGFWLRRPRAAFAFGSVHAGCSPFEVVWMHNPYSVERGNVCHFKSCGRTIRSAGAHCRAQVSRHTRGGLPVATCVGGTSFSLCARRMRPV